MQTFEFEGMPGHVCVETLELTEEDGKTTVTSVTRFDTKDDRDGMLPPAWRSGARRVVRRAGRVPGEALLSQDARG